MSLVPLSTSPICSPSKEAIGPSCEVLESQVPSPLKLLSYSITAPHVEGARAFLGTCHLEGTRCWKLAELRAGSPCLLSRKAGRVIPQSPQRPQRDISHDDTSLWAVLWTQSSMRADCEMKLKSSSVLGSRNPIVWLHVI